MYTVQFITDELNDAELKAETPWKMGDLIAAILDGLDKKAVDLTVYKHKETANDSDQ